MVQDRRNRRAALHHRLRQADRISTVRKLAGSVAHKLGTPLNVIAGRASMIADGEVTGEGAAKSAQVIVEQAATMIEAIRALVDFSRRSLLRREKVTVRDLLAQAVMLVEPSAAERSVSIELAVPETLVAHLDPGRVLQVVTNLMANAVDAMPDGGRLRLSCSAQWITEPLDRLASPGPYVVIGVQDEGRGIDVDQLEHLFEPFFSAHGAGTGLGLSVCDGIVREHGGFIDLQTIRGEGTCVAVYLPSTDEMAPDGMEEGRA